MVRSIVRGQPGRACGTSGGLPLLVAAVLAVMPAATRPAAASPPVAPTGPLTPEEERARFRLPEGFEIQLVAGEPLIQKPMNMAFDPRGRLWVTHSVEYPFAAPADAAPRDGLTVLEGIGADGRATRATRFADGLNIPIGVLPLPCADPEGRGQEVIVWSIPHIWKLVDADGDLRADTREILYGPFGVDDTHGNQNAFRLGPDGWVYACHGFRNSSAVRLRGAGEVVLTLTSGNTYRFRPDGSAIEQVSWGQVNPFGMCFDALGNQFTADCHSQPLTMILRGGRYESFGKPHDGLGFAPPATGHNHGSTGIGGVVACETGRLPPEWRGALLVGNVITNEVHRDVPAWRGSSPWVEAPEAFLACDDWWFRPVDLQLGPDGAVYVADFYNCIIGHYEVDLKHPRRDRERGRIWRVVWKADGAAPPGPADITRLADADVVALLGAPTDPALAAAGSGETLRRLAFDLLLARARANPRTATSIHGLLAAAVAPRTAAPAAADGDPATGPVAGIAAAARQRSLAVRALARLGGLDATAVAGLVRDPAPVVRVHLVKALAEAAGAADPLAATVTGLLADPDPFVRRAAAEAVAARGSTTAVPLLLDALAAASRDDRQLVHALTIAVRDRVREARPDELAGLSLDDAGWRRLVEIATTVPDGGIAWFALDRVRGRAALADLADRCLASVGQHCGDDLVDEAAGWARETLGRDAAVEAAAFGALFDGRSRAGRRLSAGSELGRWATTVATRVLDGQAAPRPAAAVLVSSLKAAEQLSLDSAAAGAIRLLTDGATPPDVRTLAAATAAALDRPRAGPVLESILADPAAPGPLRQAVARQLGAEGTPASRDAVARAIAVAPAALQQPFAVALASTPAGAETLLGLVAAGKAAPRLLQDKSVVDRLDAAELPAIGGRIASLTAGLPAADEAIRQAISRAAADYAKPPPADAIAAGAAVFRRSCANCHRLGGEGARVGPQLDGVGQRGAERLLEDILDPHRNVDEAFRLTTVTTRDGRVIAGLAIRDEGGGLVLADATGRELPVAAADIDERSVSRLSPMPANLADQIGSADLTNLVRFLVDAAAGRPQPR